jgi:YesN/AraC family two-component response regulator
MKDTASMLVVDDNARTRQALMAYLATQAGIGVVAEASNGLEACTMIKGQVPDIVLMDARMPVMDGLEATRIIKKNWPQIKIVLITMYPDYQAEALSAGADAFLVKGCPVQEMMGTIQTLLQADEEGNSHPD